MKRCGARRGLLEAADAARRRAGAKLDDSYPTNDELADSIDHLLNAIDYINKAREL